MTSIEHEACLIYLFSVNEFIMPKIKLKLDEHCFKLALDCFDEMLDIFKASGKEDEKSENLIDEAREIFKGGCDRLSVNFSLDDFLSKL